MKKKMHQLRTADAEASLIRHSDYVDYGSVSGESTEAAPVEASQCPDSTAGSHKSSAFTLRHRPLRLIFLNYVFLSFVQMSNAVLVPLMYSTPVEYGGLGLNPFAIGTVLGTFGIINTIFQAKFLGEMIRRFGPLTLYRIGILSPCIAYAMYPVMKYAAERAGGVDRYVIVCIVIHLGSRALL
jgi:hypothetical protein